MENENRYNGWKNYETWLVNLWLTEGQDDENIKEMYFNEHNEWSDKQLYDFAETIEQYVEDSWEMLQPDSACLFGDLIYASLGRVDWYEIAEAWLCE